ncbi:MAG TPA: mechanosensitive ion channel family protein [Geminicoccaceae bacterium]|nr:mechanosensitive ion channel family protein [Geminicoccaceae bacterium]
MPILLLVAALVAGGALSAQVPGATAPVDAPVPAPAPAPAPAPGDLDQLVRTLEDPASRDELLARLRALQQVQAAGAAEPAGADVVSRAVGGVSARIAAVTDAVVGGAEALARVPDAFVWLEREFRNPFSRDFYLGVLRSLGIAFGLGALAGVLAHAVPRRHRARLAVPADADLLRRLALLGGRLALEMVPPLVFVLTSLLALRMVGVSGLIQLIASQLVVALALGRTLAAIRRALFHPLAGEGRALPVTDLVAREANRWSAMIGSTAIYGYFGLRVAALLGLPWDVHGLLLHLLFLIVAAMLVALTWRLREPVRVALAERALAAGSRPVDQLVPWLALANNWHLVATAWIVLHYVVWALHVPGGFVYLLRATLLTFAVLLGARLLIVLIGHRMVPASEPAAEVETEDGEPVGGGAGAPGPAAAPKLSRPQTLAAGLARGAVWLLAVIALLEVWRVGVLDWLQGAEGRAALVILLRVALVLLAAFAIWSLLSRWIGGYIAAVDPEGNLVHSRRTRTLANIARNLILVVLLLFGALFVLSELGVNTGPLLAGAGIVGIAVGFGSQRLVQDIITGLFILIGDTIRVGDVVNLGGKSGAVEGMTMRSVTLRSYNGDVHTIPYSTIDTVTNMTRDFSYWVITIGVAYREDVDQVMQVLREIDTQLRREWPYRRLILEPLEIAGVDAFAASAVNIVARVKTRPGEQWKIGRELNRRIKKRFDELGIEIPFPHQTIYFGADKEGRAQPVLVTGLERPPTAGEAASPRPAKAVGEA